MVRMTASNLDRQVQFRRAILVDDGFQTVEEWHDHGEPVWAAKRDVSDAERWNAGRVQATITTRFTIRWSEFSADLSPTDRLICEGREYEITGIKETAERRRMLELSCTAEVSQ